MKFLLFILVIIDNLNVLLANNDNCRVNDLNALMVRLRQLPTEFNDLKIQHDATQAEIKVLKEANGKQETELEKLRQEINNKSTEIKLIKEENRKQETELEELRKDVDKKSLEIAAISKDIEMIKDIDDCSPNQCQNGSTCVDGVTSYTCSCVAGYNGTLCEIDIDDCNPNPCQNGATCTDGVDSYMCTCVAGYTGTNCETDIDDCTSNLCKNGATCNDGVNSYTCTCSPGYTGTYCDTVKKCPANWDLFKGSCYYKSKSRKWLEAEDHCIDLGGHLVEITSVEENNFIQSILSSGSRAWIGLNDRLKEGDFVWVSSGNKLGVYMNWDVGEPSKQSDNEDCVEIFSSGKWNDNDCSSVWDYICEKESMLA